MTAFLRRASLRLVNQSSIPFLLRHLERGDPIGDGYGTSQAQLSANNAQAILISVSKYCPIIYKAHVGELNKAIADEKNPRLVGICLQALAALAKLDDGLVFADKYDLVSFFVPNHVDLSMADVQPSEFCDSPLIPIFDLPSILPGYSLCQQIKRHVVWR
jgi:hypothetical protein